MEGLASFIDQQAWWRGQKACEYPEDERNQHAADALHRLLKYVSSLEGGEHNHPAIQRIMRCYWNDGEECEVLISVGHELSRFGFENKPMDATPDECENFLDYLASVAESTLDGCSTSCGDTS